MVQAPCVLFIDASKTSRELERQKFISLGIGDLVLNTSSAKLFVLGSECRVLGDDARQLCLDLTAVGLAVRLLLATSSCRSAGYDRCRVQVHRRE